MSTVKAQTDGEESFTAKLDIHLVTPATYAELIELGSDSPRVALCVIGPPGLGKTAIPKQVAKRRNAPYAAFHIPQMSVEDCHIPTMAPDTKQYYDRRITRKLQPLLDFVTRLRAENGGKFPEGRNPILAIEEINRARYKAVTQAMFTLLEDRMLGDTYIDDAIQFVVTMNPSGGAMAVNEFERDPASRRRLDMVGVTASYADFMRYAMEAKFHPQVVEHLEAQPTWMYDEDGVLSGKVFPCPSSWETVSQICYAIERRNVQLTSPAARAMIAGKIGGTAAEAFFEFCVDKTVVITPDEVLQGYFHNSTVRARFQKFLADSAHDKISMLMPGLAMKIFSNVKRPPAVYGKQLGLFMEDLPEESMVQFIKTHLKGQADTVNGGRDYLRLLSDYMAKEPAFHVAVTRLQATQARVKTEAAKSAI